MNEKSTLRKNANDYLTHTKQTNGITLIALVVTIIVLIILATISINAVLGENSLIKKAEQAVNKYEVSQIQEQLELAKLEAEMSHNKTTVKDILQTNKLITQEQINNGFIEISKDIIFITNYEGLKKLADEVNKANDFSNKIIYLIDNIDCGATFDVETGQLLKGNAFTPIGQWPNYFCGTFDGMNYTISNVYMRSETGNCRGIFGQTQNATIQNINVKNTYISANYAVGLICGYANNTKFINCNIEKMLFVQQN